MRRFKWWTIQSCLRSSHYTGITPSSFEDKLSGSNKLFIDSFLVVLNIENISNQKLAYNCLTVFQCETLALYDTLSTGRKYFVLFFNHMFIQEFVRCLPIKRWNITDAAFNTQQSINQYLSLYTITIFSNI